MSWSDRADDPLPRNHPERGGAVTQSVHPWRAVVRTVFAAVVSLLSLLPVIAATAGVDTVPAVVQVLMVTGAVTRVLALPAVEAWLRRFLPWLAAARRDDP